MNNLRTFVGKYAPNHKEFGQWVDTTADPNEPITKVYRNGQWVEESNKNTKDLFSKDDVMSMIAAQCKNLQQQLDALLEKVNFLGREIKRLQRGTAIAE